MCQIHEGRLGACTRMMCFAEGMPYCQVYQPELAIDPLPLPIIDTMPPVVNPFIGDGH